MKMYEPPRCMSDSGEGQPGMTPAAIIIGQGDDSPGPGVLVIWHQAQCVPGPDFRDVLLLSDGESLRLI